MQVCLEGKAGEGKRLAFLDTVILACFFCIFNFPLETKTIRVCYISVYNLSDM